VDPVNPQNALEGLRVVVTHNKPTLTDAISVRHSITKELEQQNDLGIDLLSHSKGTESIFKFSNKKGTVASQPSQTVENLRDSPKDGEHGGSFSW